MDKLKHAHYFPLSSQGNIYTLTVLNVANNCNKLLVASLRGEVFCFEYQLNASGMLVPSTKEVSFTYIPSGAEIISMDAFNKSETGNDFVIGITIIKNSTDLNALETYLNIYSEWEESREFNVESISQNCLNYIELKFIPYQLTHTHLVTWDGEQCYKEIAFVLSGSDEQLHVYRERKSSHTYKEVDAVEHFPEFEKPPSVVVWLDVYYYNDYEERLSAFGCECGYLRVCRISTKTNAVLFNFSSRFDNTLSHIKIYPDKCPAPNPDSNESGPKLPVLNLAVANSILPAVLFSDVLRNGLGAYATLPRHELVSVLSCVEVADVDLDGRDEILVGTTNLEIVMHKFDAERDCWCLEELKKFAGPVLAMRYVDVVGDGVRELVVMSLKGVHILQHDQAFLQRVVEERIANLTIPRIQAVTINDT